MAIATIDEALAALGVSDGTLTAAEAASLDMEGYVLLGGLIGPGEAQIFCDRFERAILTNEQWPYPRDRGMRYAKIDKDAAFLGLCLLPRVLAAVRHLFRRRFFLNHFEGREPCQNGGGQSLHRDDPNPMDYTQIVTMLFFLDAFEPANGATRLIPASHANKDPLPQSDPRETVITGKGGDALLFDARLIHSGTRNANGARRRTLIASYHDHTQYPKRFFKLEAPGASEAIKYVMGE